MKSKKFSTTSIANDLFGLKKKLFYFLIFLMMICVYQKSFAQSKIAVIRHNNPVYVPVNDSQSNDAYFNNVLSMCKVTSYKKVYPTLAMDSLFGDYFIIKCTDTSGFPSAAIDSLFKLDSIANIFFLQDGKELCSNPIAYNDPYMDQNGNQFNSNYTWALDATDAACGWNFTTGSGSVTNPPLLGIIEGNVDRTHPELHPSASDFRVMNSFIPPNTGINYSLSAQGDHGTGVCGSALAATNNNVGLTSVGHSIKCNHFEYYTPFPGQVNAETAFRCILDAIDKGSKIINCSFTNIFSYEVSAYGNKYSAADFLKDMTLNKNVTFVFAAGNYNGDGTDEEKAKDGKYEFTEGIPGVIVVGGIDRNFNCQFGTNSRFSIGPHVDLCAPAKEIMGIRRSNDLSDASQYLVVSGTSHAAPIVAAAIALMLDLKPDLTPAEIECILKSTTNPINDASSFVVNGISQVGTGRLSVFKALEYVDNLLSIKENTINVTGPVTWSSPRFLDHNVFVQNGGTLTISNTTIKFAPNVNLVVEQGGNLIIDNSILTNSVECSGQNEYIYKMWGGVVINSHGSSNAQSLSSGYVQFKNNSVIENAHIGVGIGEWNFGSIGGGILNADESTFKNCRYGVVMSYYISPTDPEVNLTKFNNMDFINDKPLAEYNMAGGNTQAWLGSVRGVKFQGCKFSNSLYGSGLRGIGAWDCKIWVTDGFDNNIAHICPNFPTGNRHSEFISLGIGIHSVGSNVTFNRLQAVSAIFNNCKQAIWTGTDQLSEIIGCDFDNDNDFTFPPLDPNNMNIPTFHHIYANESKGFTIADSKFDFHLNSSSGSANLIGIKTYKANAGTVNNTEFKAEVAKCDFNNTASTYNTYGQVFFGWNYDLYMYCNHYSGSFTRAWSGYDGSFLNDQRGKKKSGYVPGINNNVYNNNLFDNCTNPNYSIQGISGQLFQQVLHPGNIYSTFQYFADGTGLGYGGTPAPNLYPTGLCINTAQAPFIVNGWSAQCNFNNPNPWFVLEDVFCRNPLYPLIPLRNSAVVTAHNSQTITGEMEPLYDTTGINKINIQENVNNLNQFMVKYQLEMSELNRRNPEIRKKIYENIKFYSTDEKLSAYEILIHWYFEDVNKIHQIFSELKLPSSEINVKNTELEKSKLTVNVEVYPVPSNTGSITVNSNVIFNKIEIYNITGVLIKTYHGNDLSTVEVGTSGIYFVKIYNNSNLLHQTKVIVVDN